MTHDHASQLLAAFALHAIGRDERVELEDHLANCPRCQVELDAYRPVTAALGNSVEPLPDGLWSSISSRLSVLHHVAPTPVPARLRESSGAHTDDVRQFRTGRPWRSVPTSRGRMVGVGTLAVGAAAVAAVLAISLVGADGQVAHLQGAIGETAHTAVVAALDTPGHKVVNLAGADHVALAQFVVLPDGGDYLVRSTLPALASTETYQLWGVVGGQTLSLGLMGRSPNLVTFTLAGSPRLTSLGVTVEPAGGSIMPSGPMVVTGTV